MAGKPSDTNDEDQSTLTYRINTGLMWVIVIQMCAIVWWTGTYTAKADERLSALENQLSALKNLPERLARQEEQMAIANQTLRDIREELRDRRRSAPNEH